MMIGLLLYAYCTGVRSSRVIEQRCSEDVAYRVLAGPTQQRRGMPGDGAERARTGSRGQGVPQGGQRAWAWAWRAWP